MRQMLTPIASRKACANWLSVEWKKAKGQGVVAGCRLPVSLLLLAFFLVNQLVRLYNNNRSFFPVDLTLCFFHIDKVKCVRELFQFA